MNVESNTVITGLRFVKEDRIIHLQIQEGELLEAGVIGKNTTRLVPVIRMRPDDVEASGGNYFTMSWKDRAMNLDDVTINPGHVLTGVKFRIYGSHLYLRARMAPFRFTTGQLRDPLVTSTWNYKLALNVERLKIPLQRPDVPTRTSAPATVFSTSPEHVRFTHTDFEKDAGQTIVPFFDAQPVASEPPVPIGDGGVYYKGQRDFGGFVAPKIITYDFALYVRTVAVEDDIVDDDAATEFFFNKYAKNLR